MESNPSGQFGCIDDPDPQYGFCSVWTRTQTQSDGPEPLLTLRLPARLFNAWVDSLNLPWILQSGGLHSRSQQPLHSSFVERMSEHRLACFHLPFICGILIGFGAGNDLTALHEATCDIRGCPRWCICYHQCTVGIWWPSFCTVVIM